MSDEFEAQDEGQEQQPAVEAQVPPAEVTTPTTPSQISPVTWSVATSTWISNHVRNSPIAQSAEAWTHLGTILPHLLTALNAELAKQRNP